MIHTMSGIIVFIQRVEERWEAHVERYAKGRSVDDAVSMTRCR
jgi:hypothetical protein